MIESFVQLKQLLSDVQPCPAVVAAAHDEHTLQAVFAAQDDGLIRPVLVGRRDEILELASHLGHPLTGDFLYGTEDRALIPRTALHSAYLSFRHPITGERLEFELELPKDMGRLL